MDKTVDRLWDDAMKKFLDKRVKTRDPKFSDEEFDENVKMRVQALRDNV